MWKRISSIILLALVVAGPAMSGPLTNIFTESLKLYGKVSWSEGYQQGRIETLQNVILRMNDGRRYDIETLTLDHEGNALLAQAVNVRMNPQGSILLLKAEHMSFNGHAGFLKTLWNPEMIVDACTLTGPESSMTIRDFGLVLPGDGDILSEDNRYRVDNISLSLGITGTREACMANVGFTAGDYEAFLSDGASHIAKTLDFSMQLPGSLASLAAARDAELMFDIKINAARSLIPGGGTGWSVENGTINGRFSALSLVPALTAVLKHQASGFGLANRMHMWNAVTGLQGMISIVLDDMTARSSNVLPIEYVARFTDASLTTLLFDISGELEIDNSMTKINAALDVTGLAQTTALAELRVGTYPENAIERAADTQSISFDGIPPIYIDKLHYTQKDRGLLHSAESIMGVPVTIRIGQIRQHMVDKYPELVSVISLIATAAANFSTISIQNPPALLELSLEKGLDLRQALIVSRKLPLDIPHIFSFSVSSEQQ